MAESTRIAVSDTSPLIALCAVGELRLLGTLFSRVVIPIEVWNELTSKAGASEPAQVRECSNVAFEPAVEPIPDSRIALLHPGERDAISIALKYPGATVLLDEARARKIAAALGLHVVGTVGLIVEAKRQGQLEAVRPLVVSLVQQGFHLSNDVVTRALSIAGEPPL